MRDDLRKEKELNLKLREEMKRVEFERVKILEKIKELQFYCDNSEETKSDIRKDLEDKNQRFEKIN